MPVGTARAPASSTSAIGRAGAVTGTGGDRAQRAPPGRRPPGGCPRPGTRGSGRPTWPRRSRTRSSGGRDGRTSLQRAARGDANRRHRQFRGGRVRRWPVGRAVARAASPRRSSWWKSKRRRRAPRSRSGFATVTGMVTSPAFSKVSVTSRYWPGVRPSSRSVRVTVTGRRRRRPTRPPGSRSPGRRRCWMLEAPVREVRGAALEVALRRRTERDELEPLGALISADEKPSPSTETACRPRSPPLTIASCSSASSPLS